MGGNFNSVQIEIIYFKPIFLKCTINVALCEPDVKLYVYNI